MTDYQNFISKKSVVTQPTGIKQPPALNPKMFPFQRDCVKWALRRGRAALFHSCGLGKSIQELDWAEKVVQLSRKPCLLLTPIAVAEQFVAESQKFGVQVPVKICASQADVIDGINITNYHKLHKFSPREFGSVVLDESSILKHEGSKYRTEITSAFRNTPFRLEGTATPSPNDYMELGNHAEFLGIMTLSEMLSTFFVHDGGETQKWRLKGHAQDEFWRWVSSWAVNLRKPSDLGYSDDGYILPKLHTSIHRVESDMRSEGYLFPVSARTSDERRAARRCSIGHRVKYAADLVNSNDEQWIVWCGLNDESEQATEAFEGAVEVCGAQDEDEQAERLKSFIKGDKRVLVSKGSICGWGLNLQFCRNVLYLGLNDSQEMFHQTLRRSWRFGQKNEVKCHVVISNMEDTVWNNIQRKEADAEAMAIQMVKYTKEISSREIRGATVETEDYKPTQPIVLPDWLESEAA